MSPIFSTRAQIDDDSFFKLGLFGSVTRVGIAIKDIPVLNINGFVLKYIDSLTLSQLRKQLVFFMHFI